jgi:hypothetical protein
LTGPADEGWDVGFSCVISANVLINPGKYGSIRPIEAIPGGAMGKYGPLRDYLAGRSGDEEPMTFGQVERLVGPLPYSAHEHRAWWANDNAL